MALGGADDSSATCYELPLSRQRRPCVSGTGAAVATTHDAACRAYWGERHSH
jgi:hypothetical protein